MNIVLTGFMGTGKSSVGRVLAGRTGRLFVDTDQLVETIANQTVAEIFTQRGEAQFRQYEAEVVQKLIRRKQLVIATGGGLLLNPINESALRQCSQIFCLTASVPTIMKRLRGDTTRPLLALADPEARIHQLLALRAPLYSRFPQINSDDLTPEQVAEAILAHGSDFLS